jgi:hypothetical protein
MYVTARCAASLVAIHSIQMSAAMPDTLDIPLSRTVYYCGAGKQEIYEFKRRLGGTP